MAPGAATVSSVSFVQTPQDRPIGPPGVADALMSSWPGDSGSTNPVTTINNSGIRLNVNDLSTKLNEGRLGAHQWSAVDKGRNVRSRVDSTRTQTATGQLNERSRKRFSGTRLGELAGRSCANLWYVFSSVSRDGYQRGSPRVCLSIFRH